MLHVSEVRERGLKRSRENGVDTRLGWVDVHTQDGDGSLKKLGQVGWGTKDGWRLSVSKWNTLALVEM